MDLEDVQPMVGLGGWESMVVESTNFDGVCEVVFRKLKEKEKCVKSTVFSEETHFMSSKVHNFNQQYAASRNRHGYE